MNEEVMTDLCEIVEYLYEGRVMVFFLPKFFQKVFLPRWCRNL
jgi:hypothetical protein